MTNTLAEWLSLREPADWTARAEALVHRVRTSLSDDGVLRGLDLCTGTGSNLRYLLDRLPARQEWLAIDRDPVLLNELSQRVRQWAAARGHTIEVNACALRVRGEGLRCDIALRQMDLGTLAPELFDRRHLVTASALLDLVSDAWLRVLAQRCRSADAAALFAITYNGRSSCDPLDADDALVLTLFNRHQRTDKGLGGPAAGPDAARLAEHAFADAGYSVERCPSDWIVEPHEHAFQRQLIDGWAHAAREIAPALVTRIDGWHHRRLRHIHANRSRVVVNHDDLAAWLGDRG
jgi:hypothetical protein